MDHLRSEAMNIDTVEKRIWKSFETRFLRKAESADAREQIQDQLTDKVAKLDARGRNVGRLRRVVDEASELWAHRSNLRKRDLVYLAAALLYFISPLDAVPDLLPGVGYVDDVIVLSAIVAVVLRGLATLGTRGKERLEEWLDERTEIVFERFDESASNGVQKTVAAVVIGLWGATSAAAISLSVATALGRYPNEWLTYVVVSTAIVVTCNVTTGLYYWREFRKLDGQWQKRLRTLAASKLTPRHLIAIGLPILALIGLGISRVFSSF
jgi:uncharacterized membrane protein YkvA (DUF1232 family)